MNPAPVVRARPVWRLARRIAGRFKRYSLTARVDILTPALLNSLKLTILTVLILLPVAIAGGAWAASRRGKPIDHAITLGAATATTVPDFVTGILLLIVFSLGLGWFPITATAPRDADLLTQVYIDPARGLPRDGLGGYVLRMARAGIIVALKRLRQNRPSQGVEAAGAGQACAAGDSFNGCRRGNADRYSSAALSSSSPFQLRRDRQAMYIAANRKVPGPQGGVLSSALSSSL